jgi:ABC-type sugar transport system permease subunit
LVKSGGRKTSRHLGWAWASPGLIFLTLFAAIPVLSMLFMSVLTAGRFGGVTAPINFDNFSRATDPVFVKVIKTIVCWVTSCGLQVMSCPIFANVIWVTTQLILATI